MKKAVIVQARMSSKRLAGKSLLPILGKPIVWHVIDRCRRVAAVDEVILATSSDASDDPLAEWATKAGVPVFRGALDNVQKRFYDAMCAHKVDLVIRVTGDNPLISPELIDVMIQSWQESPVDYIGYSACIHGIGAELFTAKSFEKLREASRSDYDYEHVTPPYYQKKAQFSTRSLVAPPEYVHADLRLTVDTEEEYIFVKALCETYNVDGYVPLAELVADMR